ncbi:MAG: type II toxin-antitoxin system HigB family toxin [Brumimicrobium sp.]
MKIIGIRHIQKLKKKNKGNLKLIKALDHLIDELKKAQWKSKQEVLAAMNNQADFVHNDGFYFFDINIYRTMILIEYCEPGINKDGEETLRNGIAEI